MYIPIKQTCLPKRQQQLKHQIHVNVISISSCTDREHWFKGKSSLLKGHLLESNSLVLNHSKEKIWLGFHSKHWLSLSLSLTVTVNCSQANSSHSDALTVPGANEGTLCTGRLSRRAFTSMVMLLHYYYHTMFHCYFFSYVYLLMVWEERKLSVVIKHIMVVGRKKACDEKAMQGDEELLNPKKQLEIKNVWKCILPLDYLRNLSPQNLFFFFSKKKE